MLTNQKFSNILQVIKITFVTTQDILMLNKSEKSLSEKIKRKEEDLETSHSLIHSFSIQ